MPKSKKFVKGQFEVKFLSFDAKGIFVNLNFIIYNGKLITIIEVFKTWHHYLEGCKYKDLIFGDYNNLEQFMDIKSLSVH